MVRAALDLQQPHAAQLRHRARREVRPPLRLAVPELPVLTIAPRVRERALAECCRVPRAAGDLHPRRRGRRRRRGGVGFGVGVRVGTGVGSGVGGGGVGREGGGLWLQA